MNKFAQAIICTLAFSIPVAVSTAAVQANTTDPAQNTTSTHPVATKTTNSQVKKSAIHRRPVASKTTHRKAINTATKKPITKAAIAKKTVQKSPNN